MRIADDHILFKECVPIFRVGGERTPTRYADDDEMRAATLDKGVFVLTDFNLTKAIDFGDFKVLESKEIRMAGPYCAFISEIIPPARIRHKREANLFAIAFSAVLSFATSRPVKPLRNLMYSNDESKFHVLAQNFSVVVAGPGAHVYNLSDDEINLFAEKTASLIELLVTVPYDKYQDLMQAIRLVQLSLLTRRDDFSLSYYLLISAIESIAQIAVKRDKVKKKDSKEKTNVWEELAKNNPDIEELYSLYKDARGKNHYITERFVKFIIDNCPHSFWEQLPHPREKEEALMREIWGDSFAEDFTLRSPLDVHPSELNEELVHEILANMYDFRSAYTHRGTETPHTDPIGMYHSFEWHTVPGEIDPDSGRQQAKVMLLPNYRLVNFIAVTCIFGYARKLAGKK
ncbi:hypothetical protein [Paenibacillus xanthanilyticus]|uniref:Apea-like HEPN domain-containing protein n=1 Tax=Paenibacillus xanthanilyticus TaxID=1783531 RepID=A0ABV8KCC7_9BACL